MADPPLLIVVTGPPAGGKSSSSRALARDLAVPFISKDELKERLYEVFGHGDDPALEERIERAALATLFSVAGSQLAAGVPVLVEADFRTDSDTGPLLELGREHDPRIVQVHIGGETDALVEKFARRAAGGDRHPGHADEPEDAADLRDKLEAGVWEPLDLPGELVRADLRDEPDDVVRRVREVCDL